jgi:GntR family transcriptional regulator/MocR family aminotransferase
MNEKLSTLALFSPNSLQAKAEAPQYRQLIDKIKSDLESGRLSPGQMLPSTRELAAHLNVSRKTVLRAYEELLCLGTFDTAKGVGTFVAQGISSTRTRAQEIIPSFSRYARHLLATGYNSDTHEQLLSYGACPPDLLPTKQWTQCNQEILRFLNLSQKDYENTTKRPTARQLQKTLADYLNRSRQIQCHPSQIRIFNSNSVPLWNLAKLLLDAGDYVAVENPGYPHARAIFKAHGCNIQTIPIEEDGLCLKTLENLTPTPKLVYITPLHDPYGINMSIERRRELLEICERKGILIIEDDYGHEFADKQSQLPPLFSLDQNQRVIYLATFWKSLYPLTTASYMVMPQYLEEAFDQTLNQPDNCFSSYLPCLEEATLNRFITRGFLDRHLRTTRSIYRQREKHFRSSLWANLGNLATLSNEMPGMHLCLRFKDFIDAQNIDACAKDTNFPLFPMSKYYSSPTRTNEYIVSFAHLDLELATTQIQDFSNRLERTLSAWSR